MDREPRDATGKRAAEAPGAVRKGGWLLGLYEHSLSLAFVCCSLLSFGVHAVGGARARNAEEVLHGGAPVSVIEYMASSQFWFEAFQNWQSEFLSLAAMVVLRIWLRSAARRNPSRSMRRTGRQARSDPSDVTDPESVPIRQWRLRSGPMVVMEPHPPQGEWSWRTGTARATRDCPDRPPNNPTPGQEGDDRTDPRRTREDDDRDNEGQAPRRDPNQTPKTA